MCRLKKVFLVYFVTTLTLISSQNFTLQAYSTAYYMIPMFSESSSFKDFQQTINFFLALPNLPDIFEFYGHDGDYHKLFSCLRRTLHCNFRNDSFLNSTKFQQTLFNFSQTSNPLQMSQEALTLVLQETPICGFTNIACSIPRINFILLTDYGSFDELYTVSQVMQQIYYFAISSASDDNFEGRKFEIKFFYSNRDVPNSEVGDEIFGKSISYQLNIFANFYNIFLVINESSLNATIEVAENLMTTLPSTSTWGLLNPRVYSIAIKRNATFYYQISTLYLNGMTRSHFMDTVTTFFDKKSYTNLETELLEKNLQKIFSTDITDFYDSQWNVVISDRFPHWIKKANINFDSFTKHLDVYLFDQENASMLQEIGQNFEEIIVDDENSTSRGNHLMLIDFGSNTSTHQMATFKTSMDATIFTYKSNNKWWIWVIVGGVFGILSISALISFLIWRRKMHRKLAEKYSWAIKSGISRQEADELIEKGKEIFIDGNFIEVNFSEIIGKGSSAIVYEGFLSTESPISMQYPRLETRNYANCKIAVKIGNTFSKNEFEQIFREVKAAQKIGWHRHICCLLGWSVFQSMPVLMFELIPGKDLLTWAQSISPDSDGIMIPEKEITQILWQISDGMEHIASLGILHKDLAARNILLSERLEAKITDFGLASSFDESTFTYEAPTQRRLPLRWMAPEALRNRSFSEYSDVWSFGILAWEVFNKGEIPYGTIDGNDILQFISDGNRLPLPDEVSEEWKNLISKCWNEAKEERPTFREIRIQIGSFLETQTIAYGYLSCELE